MNDEETNTVPRPVFFVAKKSFKVARRLTLHLSYTIYIQFVNQPILTTLASLYLIINCILQSANFSTYG